MSLARTATPVLPEIVAPAGVVSSAAEIRRWGRITAGVLAAVYLLLLNLYWVPGGDSDFYVASARTLAQTGHFNYNGLPINISPPGWPWAMAVVMKVWPTFLALKLVTLGSMLGAMVMSYYACLRFASPKLAATCTLLAGTLLPVYSLTYFLHSEALFCLLGALALLHAFRIIEGRAGYWEWVSLIALAGALPFIRWAAVFQALLVVGVLISRGRGSKWWPRALLAAAFFGVTVGVTLEIREALKPTKADIVRAKAAGVISSDDSAEPTKANLPPEGTTVNPLATRKNRSVVSEFADRGVRSGKWFSWLLWYPSRFAAVSNSADSAMTGLGWVVVGLIWIAVAHYTLRGQYLWLALAGYSVALCFGWPNPNARYFVPVAPLVVLGVVSGLSVAGRALGRAAVSLRRARGESIDTNADATSVNDLAAPFAGRVRASGDDRAPQAGRLNDLDLEPGSPRAYRESLRAGRARLLRRLAPRLGWVVAVFSRAPRLVRPVTLTFLGSLVVCNVATLAKQIQVMRSGENFYLNFEAGQHQGVVNIGHYLTTSIGRPLDDGDLIVSERYENLGRIRYIGTGPREVVLLTERVIRVLPDKFQKLERPSPPFRKWMDRETKADYLILQDPSVPWRVWHFRLPMWLFERLARKPENFTGWTPSGGWRLYELKEGDLREVTLPDVKGWPTRVPGM